jgi:hypothetical protein
LFIVENAHFSLDEITPKLIESANENQEASFIFTSRKIFPGKERRLILNPFEEWEEREWYVDLKPGLEVTRDIIKTFISAKKWIILLQNRMNLGWKENLENKQ